MNANIRLYTIVGLVAFGAIFIVQNSIVVEVRLLFWTLAMSRSLMIVFLLLLGFVIGWLVRGHSLRNSDRSHNPPS